MVDILASFPVLNPTVEGGRSALISRRAASMVATCLAHSLYHTDVILIGRSFNGCIGVVVLDLVRRTTLVFSRGCGHFVVLFSMALKMGMASSRMLSGMCWISRRRHPSSPHAVFFGFSNAVFE